MVASLLSALSPPLAICAGAVPGALSRYYLTVILARRLSLWFPYGTVLVNLSGSLLIGFVSTMALYQLVSSEVQLLLVTGFLGSYTTFSTYALDTTNLARLEDPAFAFCYWAGSVVGGGLCLEVGIRLAHSWL